ncbi:hypothetical protein FACS1894191_3460 [Clostridia bacterium]|nr:hypothetical protein FACS1894191_3460 [Clostridia bacterium]
MKYTLTHKITPVLEMELDEGTGTIIGLGELYTPERVPVGISVSGGDVDRQALNAWWIGRSIPASRSGLREALETLQISSPALLLTKCYGLSLSDQYWVCPEGSGLKWENINFFDHPFSDDLGNVLFGEAPKGDEFNLMSPDNTSDGWLKKKWIIADGKRRLVKGGSGATRQEPYNELLAGAVMKRLGVAHVPYTLTVIDEYPYSMCEDFITPETELISAWHIMQVRKKPNHVSAYQHYLDCCGDLGIPGAADTLDRMLAVDYIIANEDRHFNNFGAVRNADTLKWAGAAPIYDCGTSMWCSEPTAMIRPLAKLPSKPFNANHSEQIHLVKSFGWLDFSALRGIDEEFREILAGSAFVDNARRDALCYALRKRVQMLAEYTRARMKSMAPRKKDTPER